MKTLLLGILVIVIIGTGGLVYRNAVEHPSQPIACPTTTFECPDGTELSHSGLSCNFPACPPPNVTLTGANISFALPIGFIADVPSDPADVAVYQLPPTASSTLSDTITIRQYAIASSSTALATIEATAIGLTSGVPVNPTAFSSKMFGIHRFTVVIVDRFEGTIDTAYYLSRGTEVLRFDAVDQEVDWTNPNLDVSKLPAHRGLEQLLTTLQGG